MPAGFVKLTAVVSDDLYEHAVPEEVWIQVASIAGLQRRAVKVYSAADQKSLVEVEITLIRCNGVAYGVRETPEEVFEKVLGGPAVGI